MNRVSRPGAIVLLVSSTLLIGGCHQAPPAAPVPAPIARTVRDSTRMLARVLWAPHLVPTVNRYHLRSIAKVTLVSDSAATSRTIESSAGYTFTTTMGSDSSFLEFTITIDSIAARAAGSEISSRRDSATVPIHIRGTVSPLGRIESFQVTESDQCQGGNSPFAEAVYDFMPVVVSGLETGMQWRDSTLQTSCRGSLAITTKAVHIYRLAEPTTWHGHRAMEVIRTTSLQIATPKDSGRKVNHITVAGDGDATTTFLVDSTTAVLLQAINHSSMRITVTSDHTPLPFKQEATDTTTIMP